MKLDVANVKFYLKIYIEFNCENIEYYIELDFVKIEFQNRSISLNILERKVFYYLILKLRVFTNFARIT